MGFIKKIKARAGEEYRRVKIRRKIDREAAEQARKAADRAYLTERAKVLEKRAIDAAKARANRPGFIQQLKGSVKPKRSMSYAPVKRKGKKRRMKKSYTRTSRGSSNILDVSDIFR